jgi:hypothetical protein
MDFTYNTLLDLLGTLQKREYTFITFSEYMKIKNEQCSDKSLSIETALAEDIFPLKKCVILRHDIEKEYYNAFDFAKIEEELHIKGSYYFRLLKNQTDSKIIKQIADLGHEIGYQYDDLSVCKGNTDVALERFRKNLAFIRTFGDVSTISMEGAPLSAYDNRSLWDHHNYSQFDIQGEPYFDTDFKIFYYLTDTSRRWDGWKYNIRDKVPQQDEWTRQGYVYRTTQNIIDAANSGKLPLHLMITFHPQRWQNKKLPWLRELILQRIKNIFKWVLIRLRKENE